MKRSFRKKFLLMFLCVLTLTVVFSNNVKVYADLPVDTIVDSSSGLNRPCRVAVDSTGNVYIADTNNNAIKKWDKGTGSVTPIVPSGLNYPYGVAVDSIGNVYIADLLNNAIKKWDKGTGSVATIVSGLNSPCGVAVDSTGNLYIADTNNNAIKKITASAAPTASPAGGAVVIGTQVNLSSTTAGADIYYTVDGSTPTTSSIHYTAPITINSVKTIKAIAVKDGMLNSNVMSESYTLIADASNSTVTASPVIGVADGTAESTITVTLKDANNNVVSGKTVELAQGSGSSTITASNAVTDSNGQAKFTVKDTTLEVVTYTATDTTDNVTVTQKSVVSYTSDVAYKVEHYKKDLSGNYGLAETENLIGTIGAPVSAISKNYTGFIENTSALGRVANGIVLADGSLVLKLYYDRNSYTVTYDSQGATKAANPTVQSVTYEATTILPTNPIKTGYTFGGWYTAVDGGGTSFNSFTPVYNNIIVYAKWNKIPVTPSSPIIYYNTIYNVIYDGNGNTSGYVAVASVSYQQGTIVTVLENGVTLQKQDIHLQDGIQNQMEQEQIML